MGIRLSKGSHEIKLTYSPYMFKEGLAISCVCILVIALASVIPAVADKRRAKTVSPVPEQILEEIPFDIHEEKAEETVAEEAASESELPLPEQAAEDSPADDAGDEPG